MVKIQRMKTSMSMLCILLFQQEGVELLDSLIENECGVLVH